MSNTALRLTYYNIADGVCAFSTTRHGGTSDGNHASLNINPSAPSPSRYARCCSKASTPCSPT